MKTPISYYGGKQTMLKYIMPLIPKHEVYTESFCGGAAVYWAKNPSKLEVLNDINMNLINFYKVLQHRFNDLQTMIKTSLHSRDQYEFASIVYDYPQFFDEVMRAWAVWIKSKMGFASMLDGTFGYDKTSNSLSTKLAVAKASFTTIIARRIEHTQIESTSALKIIESRDSKQAFHFVDPPYVNSDCGHYEGTFNLMDFQKLLELLSQIEGKFMLTMYPHDVIDEFAARFGWNVIAVERTISVSTTNRRKQPELIVINYNKPQKELDLFI